MKKENRDKSEQAHILLSHTLLEDTSDASKRDLDF